MGDIPREQFLDEQNIIDNTFRNTVNRSSQLITLSFVLPLVCGNEILSVNNLRTQQTGSSNPTIH